jgi:AraC-like DNA-binding protein
MLRVDPVSALEWILEPWFRQGPRITPDVNWMWIPDGRGEVLVGKEEHPIPVRPGDHIFLPPGVIHIERFPMRRRWRMLSLHFTASLFGGQDFLTVCGFPLHVPGSGEGDPLGVIAERLCREYAHRAPGWSAALRTGMEEALLHVMRHQGSRFKAGIGVASGRMGVRLLPVFKRVEMRLGDSALSIDDLAQVLHVSDVRFRKIFRQATGMKPVRYIQRRRIEVACRLLMQTDRTVKDIAAACGFSDLTFFHRIFRQWTGVTPGIYRERLLS